MLHLGLPAYKVLLSFLHLLMAQKHSIEWSSSGLAWAYCSSLTLSLMDNFFVFELGAEYRVCQKVGPQTHDHNSVKS